MSCGYRRIQKVVDIWDECYRISEDSVWDRWHSIKRKWQEYRRRKSIAAFGTMKIPQICYRWIQELVKRLEKGSQVLGEWYGLYHKVSEDPVEETEKCYEQSRVSPRWIWCLNAGQTRRGKITELGRPIRRLCWYSRNSWVPRQV